MTRPNYNLIKFIKRCIRQMKKEYGNTITVYKLGTATTNYDTGVKTHTRESAVVRRAVVLPARLLREVTQTISLISANKQIVQGGSYDTGKRHFIIERSDVPSTFELAMDDWIVYDGNRYDITAIDEFEYKTAWIVVAKKIEGVVPEQDLYGKGNSYMLDMTQSVTATIV